MNDQKGKKEKVRSMFNDIAPKYDFLNHFLSAGIDKLWRKKVRKILLPEKPETILDVATGTGDLAVELAKLKPKSIIGIDIAADMLEVGKEKIKRKNLDKIIKLQVGDSEKINFPDNYFDAVTVAFGVRNYENLQKGLKEMNRVMKIGGKTVILEFSKPRNFPVKNVYNFYFKHILPQLGRFFSKNDEAYSYLPDSVSKFPEGENFINQLINAGFKNPSQQRLTFGIATIYTATK
jgi:demethylmenaquinone methyltransferase/2-methoxy-6-polyprenyl-1,4-benzoquinol methylase